MTVPTCFRFAATCALGLFLFLCTARATSSSASPHLVFILVDDLGFNDFSWRSSDLGTVAWNATNALLKEAIRIDQYYTQPLCTPTRGAFMSGRFPARLGLQHGVIAGFQDYGLPLDEVTLADKLRDAGYKTYAAGKWHLGCYNFNSTPTYRGFDTYLGYYNGAEDYLTHEVGGYLDLHRQNGTQYEQVDTEASKYSTPLFTTQITDAVAAHKRDHAGTPGFFYVPLQNVHAPLESPGGKYDDACAAIPNADRRTFCAMAAIADEAIANITAAVKTAFAGEDYVVVVSGDNGGMPNSAGNNWPLRGHKAEMWEGGIRNNAIVYGSLVPSARRGTTYWGGMMHVTDWHATFAALGGATLSPKGALDGINMWPALTAAGGEQASPRSEFLVNYDPCSGHGSCSGVEFAYRMGDWKLLSGVAEDTWYPVPTSEDTDLASTGPAHQDASGNVWWDESHYVGVSSTDPARPGQRCIAAVKQYCPDGVANCTSCIVDAWNKGELSTGCRPFSGYSELVTWFCSGGTTSTVYLYNITADPYEQTNVAANHSDVVAQIQAKVDAIVKGGDYLAPCNIPDGSCYESDAKGTAAAEAHNGWYPWL